MTTSFTPIGTALINGMVDPQRPWVMLITRTDGKVEAYGYPAIAPDGVSSHSKKMLSGS